MKFIVSCCLFLGSCATLLAQSDFRVGYVINSQKDSISGYVLFNESDHPAKCYFRESKKGSTITFSAEQIEAFGIVGGYRFASIQINDKREFAKHLLDGKISLYLHRKKFYIMAEMIKALDKNPGTSGYYKQVLNPIISECKLSADEVDYGQRGLTNLLKNYNNCLSGASKEYKPRDESFSMATEVLAALDMSSYSSGKANIVFDNDKSFSAGVGLNFSSPGFSKRVSAAAEFWFSHSLFHGYGVYERSGSTHYDDYFAEVNAVSVPISIRIAASPGNNSPYVRIGVAKDFRVTNKVKIVRDRVFGGLVNSEVKNSTLDGSAFAGVWGGIGYTGTLFGYQGLVEVRFEKTGMGELVETQNPIGRTNIKFLLGIRL
jgi:hypothetical protein